MGAGFATGIQRKERSRKSLKQKWDNRASQLLDCMEGSGNVLESGSEVFDKYVFFGVDEEEAWKADPDTNETEFGDLTPAQRHQNATLRSALRIMGSDTSTEWTHVDLALRAENKDFMGHRYTNKFMDDIWLTDCASEKGLHRCAQWQPRYKYYSHRILCCIYMPAIDRSLSLIAGTTPGCSAGSSS